MGEFGGRREKREILRLNYKHRKEKKFKNKNKKENDTFGPVFIRKDCLDYQGCSVLLCEF